MRLPHALSLLIPLAFAACTTDGLTPSTDGPISTDGPLSTDGPIPPVPPDMSRPAPAVHRPQATACTAERPAYNCYPGGRPGPVLPCTMDKDCNDPAQGRNGRCIGGRAGCSCSYEKCTVDADCPDRQLCDCRSPSGQSGSPARCLPGNCRIDADCGPNGYCSPSFDPQCGAYFGVTGWYCHTAKDTCLDDRDCANADGGGFGAPYCGYRPEVGHWACATTQCAG